MIIDLHSHTVFSDGALIPAEQIQRAAKKGYSVIGLTDHADFSNYQFLLDRMLAGKEQYLAFSNIKVLIGVEITHVPPKLIEKLAFKCREAGAEIVVVHGETMVEPVEEGTNLAAIDACVDILAHPGFISQKEANLAAQNNVLLEITRRGGHCLTNGHVLQTARKASAKLSFDSDAHSPSDLYPDFETYQKTAFAAGVSKEEFDFHYDNLKKRFLI